MNRYYPILQGYVFIAREGNQDGGGTVTKAAPPAHDSPAWVKAGETINGELSVEIETATRTEIQGGKRVKIDEIIAETFTLKATIQELNKLIVDLFFNSDQTANDAFIASGSQGRKAWVRFQAYAQNNANRILLEGFAMIQPSGPLAVAGEDFIQAEFDMTFEGRPSGAVVGAYPA
jgi:hypothetical protein